MAERGTIIEGKYEVLKLIGKGGMSKVYLAMDKNLNKQWAIKEIERKAYDKNNEVVVASAMAEANMMKKLDYPSLPRIVDCRLPRLLTQQGLTTIERVDDAG